MRRNELFEFKQFNIQQSHTAMKVGTDSDLLGTLSQGGEHTLDIGTGTGVLSLMLAQRYPNATIHAIEIDENACVDAQYNIDNSPFRQRITLQHIAFQDYIVKHNTPTYDSIVCNPPYFDQSLENDDLGRRRARHSSSLPFTILAKGVSTLLKKNGTFSVCIPPEVLNKFCDECLFYGLNLDTLYRIKTKPEKDAKRFVAIFRNCYVDNITTHNFCLRNSDNTRSSWYIELMQPFHL
ncbi:MAG: methyltransferase [Bacteroidales bacterium]|nr:methyltransferase [Bacteroidales bacterium]